MIFSFDLVSLGSGEGADALLAARQCLPMGRSVVSTNAGNLGFLPVHLPESYGVGRSQILPGCPTPPAGL